MAIALLGDIHGFFDKLKAAEAAAFQQGANCLIQVGDFGWYAKKLIELRQIEPHLLPVFFLDGNHERHEMLFARVSGDVTEMWGSQLFYIRRGSVLELDGRRIGFLGGAGSIDKDIRLANGWHWSDLEQINRDEVERLVEAGPVDMLITHCPPQSTIVKHFENAWGKDYKVRMFGVSPDWTDPSAFLVEEAWQRLGCPPLYCGHMHKSIQDGNVRILNIDELVFV